MQVLLVALGRMGQRYQKAVQTYFGENLTLVTVDPKTPTNPAEHHYATIEDVPQDRAFDLAIDARPNQDRLSMLKEFLARKIPHLVIEKPHATSMAESAEMIALLKSAPHTPRVLSPFYERYGQHYQADTLAQLNAGPLKSMVLSAGAIGLGCNGIHFVDLANHLFQAEPVEVYARLQPGSIPSPRGPQFMDDSGTMIVQYPNNRECVLHLLPDSSVGISIALQYAHGKIQIMNQIHPTWTWYRQPEETWEDPYYRTSRELLVPPPCPYEEIDLVDCIGRGLQDLIHHRPHPNLMDAHNALRVIALAHKSHLERKPIAWSDKASVEDITFQFT